MMYEFMAEDGRIIEQNHPMATAPDQVEQDGIIFKRVAFSPANKLFFNAEQVNATVSGYPRTDMTIPRGTDLGYGTDPAGHPIIKSQQHEREVMARHGFKRD